MPTAVLDGNRTCQPLSLTLSIRLVSSEKNIGFTVPPKDNQFRNVLFRHTYFAYVNGDILFTQGLVDTLQFILSSRKINQTHPMLIVGQRTNVKHVSAENASSHKNIIKISKTGKLFTACMMLNLHHSLSCCIAFLIYSHYSEH
jgi:hypothetical protein